MDLDQILQYYLLLVSSIMPFITKLAPIIAGTPVVYEIACEPTSL